MRTYRRITYTILVFWAKRRFSPDLLFNGCHLFQAERAAKDGVSLMLSGHTHGGQIRPFGYLVRSRYPLLEGRYEADGMTAIVCRGTITWGPCMRRWHPGEILRVTMRAKGDKKLSK